MSNVGEQMSKAAESARETVAKVGESVSDFFQGNPFTTPVGKKIELATDAKILATENWGLNMEICDFINSHEDGPRDAIRAIRKRLQTSMAKNNAVVMYTLTVLETAVKNCDGQFHELVCNKDFILDFVRLVGPKYDAPPIVQERVLGLVQAWADAFKNDPRLSGVVQVYEDLKAKGVEFPAADLDSLAPIKTPKRTYDVLTIREQGQEPIIATPEQLTKLRSDLDVVNQNIKVFRETLTGIVPRQETAEELQLLTDLHSTCKQMQNRILDLIKYVSNEEVTYELLMVNDSFNSVFEKYDRFISNRENPSQNLIELGEEKSLEQQLSQMKVTSANGVGATSSTQEAYKANAEPQTDVGLATAVNNKIPSASEAAEMEQWLETQKEEKQPSENDKL